jgi:hypothetical protein
MSKSKRKSKAHTRAKGKARAKASKKPAAAEAKQLEVGPSGKNGVMYGGFELQLGDHDLRQKEPAVYGGMIRQPIFKDDSAAVAPGATSGNLIDRINMVAALRDDLWHLGFWVFPRQQAGKDGVIRPVPSDAFDWQTAWAVREFQIAASMPNVAVEDVNKKPSDDEAKKKGSYLSRLSARKNDKVYKNPPCGVVTSETAELIKYWIEKHYRCPVVIQAMKMVPGPKPKGKKTAPLVADGVRVENIWRHDEVTAGKTKMYAWDFSGHYDFPDDHTSEQIPVGCYRPKGTFGGPIADRNDSWPVARVTPQSWRGKDWAAMSKEERSTWRAIMAVADQECGGGLDVVNFWDNCHGSAGHYHWTMPKSDGSGGEFCGFMAMLEAKHPEAFKTCFGQFGLWGPRWVGSTASDQRGQLHPGVTYNGFVYTKDVDGNFVRHPQKGKFREANWLRSWHAAYRLEMAARTCADYRKAMWDYAFLRIKGIRTLSDVDAWLPAGCKIPGKRVTLGDLFTSERGIAFVLRLHVWRPAGLIVSSKGKKGKGLPILHDALEKLMAEGTLMNEDKMPMEDESGVLKWQVPIGEWKDPHECILLDTMLDFTGQYTKPSAKGSVQRARFWPLLVDQKQSYALVLEEAKSDKKTSPKLPVRQNSPGLPRSPDRKNRKEDEVRRDLAEFQPSSERGSFLLAE